MNRATRNTLLGGAGLAALFASAALKLDLDDPAVASKLICTRAFDAYCDDQFGNWLKFLPNIPRIVTGKGALVEEPRTNSVRNNSMQGAVAGVVGSGGNLGTNWICPNQRGLTLTVGTPTTENGVDINTYRFSGTPSSTGQVVVFFEGAQQIAALTAQVWTGSAFRAVSAGSLTNVAGVTLIIGEYDSGGAFVTSQNGADVTGTIGATLTRYSQTATLIGGASTAFVRNGAAITVTSGLAIDVTFKVGWPQLELGAFATSPIRTTSVAVSRSPDTLDYTALVPTFPMTLFSELVLIGNTAGTFPGIFGWSDNTNSNIGGLLYNGTSRNPGLGCTIGGVETCTAAAIGNMTIGGISRVAGVLGANDAQLVLNGGAMGAQDNTITVSNVLNRFMIGRFRAGSNYMNGYIRRVAYWPRRLTNAELQLLTRI